MPVMPFFFLGSITLNLVIPGAGFALAGFYGRAILVQGVLWLCIASACWTRWILEPIGLLLAIGLVAAIHIVSSILLAAHIHQRCRFRFQNLAGMIAFTIATTTLLYGGFITKDQWLGIHVFHIPSPSMAPTLQSGDFILTDTWCYTGQRPNRGDVAVFSPPTSHSFAVKRIERVIQMPAGHWSYFMVGDNRTHSADSRDFGAIPQGDLIGPVSIVLFPLDRFLKEVSRCRPAAP